MNGWIDSPGHHRNLIDPRHTVLHAGIAMGKYFPNMVQVFSGDYFVWSDPPSIENTTLTAAGHLRNACWPVSRDYSVVSIAYHPPTHQLTVGQMAGTYGLELDIRVGRLLRPLQQDAFYIDPETGQRYTDYAAYTVDNVQTINPYELPVDRVAPTSARDALAQHRAAKEKSNSVPNQESVAYSIVAERYDITPNLTGCGGMESQFDIRADLSPVLSHYGPGIYTVQIWATTRDGEPNLLGAYPIWWRTQPTPGHPY